MDEAEFWGRLEFRICEEFAGFADRQLRHYWCDGLVPEEYDLAGAEPHINGVAYGPGGELPAGRVLRLRHQPGPRADRPGALPAEVLD